jgi:hypothetical protein
VDTVETKTKCSEQKRGKFAELLENATFDSVNQNCSFLGIGIVAVVEIVNHFENGEMEDTVIMLKSRDWKEVMRELKYLTYWKWIDTHHLQVLTTTTLLKMAIDDDDVVGGVVEEV